MKLLPFCIAFITGVVLTTAGAKLWLHDKEVIDRSFLAQLRNIPIEHDNDDDEVYGRPIWENAEALHYLARTGDPDAVRVVVRLMARGYVPGGCCCTSEEFNQDAMANGPTPAFWSELSRLTPTHQVRVIEAIDRTGGYSEAITDSRWDTDRDKYLAAQPLAQSQYALRQAEAVAAANQALRDRAAQAEKTGNP